MKRLGFILGLSMLISLAGPRTAVFANNPQMTFTERKITLKDDVNREILHAKQEARELRKRADASSRRVMDKLDQDIRDLEAQADRIGDVTANTWYSVKADTERYMDRVKDSLENARKEID